MRRIAGIVLLSVLLAVSPFVSSCAVNPATGERDFVLMSQEQEIQLGREQDPILAQVYEGPVADQQLQAYVSKMGHQLAEVSHAPDYPYHFRVVNSSTPNAFALPGGFVNITRGLLIEMETEAQLAAVLSHEIAHVTARHGAQQQSRGVLTQVLLTAGQIALGQSGVQSPALYGDLAAVGAQAILASYSRAQEAEADRFGIRYAHQAGYDPQGMVQLHRLLLSLRESEPGRLEQIFATHPRSEQRIEQSQRIIRNLDADNVTGQPLNRFQQRVADVWHPRREAYREYDRALEAYQDDDPQQAIERLNSAIQIYDGEALFHAWKGILLTLETEEVSQGREALDRAINLNEETFRVWFFSGINHFYGDRYQQSLDHLDRTDDLLEGIPLTMFYRARNYEELGNRERAREWFRRFLNTNPSGWRAEYARQRV